MLTDFSQLPDVEFCERDTGKIAASIITMYEGITNTVVYPGDPVHKFLLTLAAVIAQRNVILDYAGKQNLLRYSGGNFLDHIGAMLGVTRLGKSAAETTMRYEIQAPLAYPVLIPVGNRTTADSKVFWATKALAGIKAGETYVDVPAECLTPGTEANGLVAGQIGKLVDPLAHPIKVSNLTETAGGTDDEADDEFRNRIRLAPESFTTAGSELSYVFWALSARSDISDVSVHSPTPGVVHVMALLSGGRIPEEDGPEIEAVREAVSGKRVRPLTDQTLVMPPEPVEIDYRLEYRITEPQAAYAADIDAAVGKAVADYEAWQCGAIGRDVNPDELVRACRAAGAKRIVATRIAGDGTETPFAFESLTRRQVVRIAERDDRVTFGGTEDD